MCRTTEDDMMLVHDLHPAGFVAALAAIVLIGLCPGACAQETRGDLKRRLENRRSEIENAWLKFSDRSLPAVDRAMAVSGVGSFVTPEQAEGAARIFKDATEPVEIRAQALRRIPNVGSDPALSGDVFRVLADQTAPKELREAAGDVVQGVLISAPTIRTRMPEYLALLRGMTDDADQDVRERAFAILASQGDDFATQKLIESLRTPEKAVLPPAKSARLLAQNPHGDHRPVFLSVLQQPPDRATEVEVIRGLGGYAPAKDALQSRGRDVTAPKEVRSAALQAMLATDKSAFIQVARDVVEQDEAPDEVRMMAIEGIGVARRAPGVRYDAGAVDRAVKKALDSKAPALRRAAWNSLKQFDPKFGDYANQAADKEPNPELKSAFKAQIQELRSPRDSTTRPSRPQR
jgi:hypothetical protein